MINLVCIRDDHELITPSEQYLECPNCSATYKIVDDIPRFMPEDVDSGQEQVRQAFSFKWGRDEWGFKPEHIKLMRSFFWERFGFSEQEDVARLFEDKFVVHAGIGSGQAEQHYLHHCKEVWGVDLSDSVDSCLRNWKKHYPHLLPKLKLVQADLMRMPFSDGAFDIAISDGVLHHTPNTFEALRALTNKIKNGGLVIFYVYKKKAPVREFVDDYIRDQIRDLRPEEAWKRVEPLTALARELSRLRVMIRIPETIESLKMQAGEYDLQRWLYWHVMKFYWNESLNFDENNHINFDWYYPAYAWRHDPAEVEGWLANLKLRALRFHVGESGISVIAKKEGS